MTHNDVTEVIEELFESLLSKYRINLQITTRGINFIFDCDNFMYYKCYKTNAVFHILTLRTS